MEVDEGRVLLTDLPTEILIHICNFLEAAFVRLTLSKVNTRLARLAQDPVLWRLRITSRWRSRYPPVPPTDSLWRWDEACEAREKFCALWHRPEDKTENLRVRGHYASVDAVLVVSDQCKELVVSGSRDRSIALWNPEEMTQEGQAKNGLIEKKADVHKGWVWSLSVDAQDPFGHLVSCGWDNKAHVWQISPTEMVLKATVNCRTALLCSDVHSATKVVTVGTFDKKVKSFDLRSPNQDAISQYKHHKMPVLDVVAPADRDHFFITASEDGTVALVDRRNRKVVKRKHFPDSFPMCMGLMPGCDCLVVGDKTGNLHLMNSSTLESVKQVKGLHSGKITGLDVSQGGIVTCSSDRTVKLIQPDLGAATISVIDQKDFGEVTAVSCSERTLMTGHSLEMVQVWRPKSSSQQD